MLTLSAVELQQHLGPWTEETFLALPVSRGVELLDGSLLVSPLANRVHQRLSSRLWQALDDAAPPGFEVYEAINVRVGPDRILGPDLAVVTNPGLGLAVTDAADVALVVEITSPGNLASDRAVKPPLYAQAGIPHYLRIELAGDQATALAFTLEGDRYVEMSRVPPGELTLLRAPFSVTFDLAALTRTARPGS